MHNSVLEFLNQEIEDEWARLRKEFSGLPQDQFIWQPGLRVHSIGWHVRHAIEWRYALVHVWISGNPAAERLLCLGWEKEPIIQAISLNHGWYEPQFTVADNLSFLKRVQALTRSDLESLPESRYSEVLIFPWRRNRLVHEVAQDIRHSALHRGHIRQLKKMYAEQCAARDLPRNAACAQLPSDIFPLQ